MTGNPVGATVDVLVLVDVYGFSNQIRRE